MEELTVLEGVNCKVTEPVWLTNKAMPSGTPAVTNTPREPVPMALIATVVKLGLQRARVPRKNGKWDGRLCKASRTPRLGWDDSDQR